MTIRRIAIAIVLSSLSLNSFGAAPAEPLRLLHSTTLPSFRGRFGQFTLDTKRNHLFVGGITNGQIAVIDVAATKVLKIIPSVNQPQDVLYLPDLDVVAATSGGSGRCLFFDPETFEVVRSVDSKRNADMLRYDPESHKLYMGYGGALAIIDPATAQVIGDIELPGHPEAFEIDRSGNRIFANLTSLNQIAVIDRQAGRVVSLWTLPVDIRGNIGMALDEANHRLFIGDRRPSRLLVYDTDAAVLVANLSMMSECGRLSYDAADKRIFASCGGGTIDIFSQSSPDSYSLAARIPINIGATASLFVPDIRRYFIISPSSRDVESTLLEYEVLASEPSSTASATTRPATPPTSMPEPSKVTFDFERLDTNAGPPSWKIESTNQTGPLATWQVIDAPGDARSGRNVLALTLSRNTGDSYNICWTNFAQFRNGSVEVALKPVGGKEDQGGGPIWRVKDRNNYYLARVNPLEKNFRLYIVKDGKRTQLASADVDAPANQWHSIKITHEGDHITAALDGKQLLEANDASLPASAGSGVGVWTKADAATSFDNLTIIPSASK